MSIYTYAVCYDCNEYISLGKLIDKNGKKYCELTFGLNQDEKMMSLSRFMAKHIGHKVAFLDEMLIDDSGIDFDNKVGDEAYISYGDYIDPNKSDD